MMHCKKNTLFFDFSQFLSGMLHLKQIIFTNKNVKTMCERRLTPTARHNFFATDLTLCYDAAGLYYLQISPFWLTYQR